MVWLNKVKNPQPTAIVSVIDRPKGLILVGEDWDFFSWTDSKQYVQIQNALTKACKEEIEVPAIIMNPSKDGKVKLQASDVQKCTWRVNGNKFISSLLPSDEDEPDELF